MSRNTILHVASLYPNKSNPSAGIFIFNQIKQLTKMRVENIVVSPVPVSMPFRNKKTQISQDTTNLDQQEGKAPVFYTRYLSIPLLSRIDIFRPLCDQFIGEFIIRSLKAHISNISLIHAHFGIDGYQSLWLRKKLNVPLITSLYGFDMETPYLHDTGRAKKLFAEGDLFLVLSRDMAQRLKEKGCPDNKIVVLSLGVDCKEQFQYKKRIRGQKTTFLILSHFVEKKGIIYGIEAFANIIKEHPNVELRIVGRGPLEDKLKNKVRSLKLDNRIKFINNYEFPDPREIVLNEYYSSDIFVLPSVDVEGDYGGTPTVLMEAQATGMPCITTDDAANSELVIDNITGFVVKQKDVDALTAKMIELIEKPDLCVEFGKNARVHVEKNFNQEIQVAKLKDIYTEVIKLHRGL